MLYFILSLVVVIIILGIVCYFVIRANGQLKNELKTAEGVLSAIDIAQKTSNNINSLNSEVLKEKAKKWTR